MPDVLIRNIDEETLEKLKAKAAANNRSLQNELHEMIARHAGYDLEKFKNIVKETIEDYKANGIKHSDSVEIIRELRDSR
jgi:plasmid stability protein